MCQAATLCGNGLTLPSVNLIAVYTSIYEEIAICIDSGGNGSSSPHVAIIWQVARVTSLYIPLVAMVGRLPVLE